MTPRKLLLLLWLAWLRSTPSLASDENMHFYDLACSDVYRCICSMSGVHYQADCYHSTLASIPPHLSFNITLLIVQGTQLPSLTIADLEPYAYLEVLRLTDNPALTVVEAGVLDEYMDLIALHVSDNSLATLDEALFANTPELVEFMANGNKLTAVPSLSGLAQLEAVYLQDNSLASLPAGLLTGCTSLTELNLKDNELQSLSDGFFSDVANLQELDLSGNKINTMSSATFSGLTSVENVYLSGNALTRIPASIFPDSSSTLVYLDLSSNEISEMDNSALVSLTSLESLKLSDNKLTSVPAALGALESLTSLDLHGNLFTALPAQAFAGLGTVTELFVSGMESLVSLDTAAFDGLMELTRLDLSGNPGLEELTVAHLPDEVHPKLTQIYVNDCGFVHLEEALFSTKSSLAYVDLYGNPFNCSCALKWMPRVVGEDVIWAQHWDDVSTPPTCYTPIHLRDFPIPSMLEDDMTCEELEIAAVSPPQQTVHLHQDANFTAHLFIGLPSSRWVTPNQEVIIPFPVGQLRMYMKMYATYQYIEDNAVEAILHVKNVTTTASGRYELVATNIVGDKSMWFELSVLPYELTTTTEYMGTQGDIGSAGRTSPQLVGLLLAASLAAFNWS